MLAKKERLTRSEFGAFFVSGKRIHTPSLQIIFTPHDRFKASVVVPKKVVRSAVGRNKIRRQVYEILRKINKNKIIPGVCIVIAKKGVATASFKNLTEEFDGAVGKLLR